MNDIEHASLKKLLRVEAKEWENHDFLLDTIESLDEDSGGYYLTLAEQKIFNIDLDYYHKLRVAYAAYEVLIGLIDGKEVFPDEVERLIVKARAICPPAKWYEHEQGFKLQCDEPQWFMWFASEFLDIPVRQSRAYYGKREFNLMSITTFNDEE